MMRWLVPLIAAMGTGLAHARDWADVQTPAPGPPQSIGYYTAGCVQGAEALPLQGPGYEVIRISRNRYWGQPVNAGESFETRRPAIAGVTTRDYLRTADSSGRFLERLRQNQ